MTSTSTKPPTDRTMSQQLIARTHPGAGEVERIGWYRVCESMPLSDRHAAYILDELKRRAG